MYGPPPERVADSVGYVGQTPEQVAQTLLEGLRADAFLISCTADIREKLGISAEHLLDPAALASLYTAGSTL